MKTDRPRVLLIEDNAADANLVEEAMLEAELDCDLSVVRDGALAIEFFERLDSESSGEFPHLVLLDLNLPKIPGEAVLARVRLSPKYGAVKVFIISSSDAPIDRERAMKLGATDYFRKPSNLAQFMELGPRIRAMLEGSSAGT
jgi:DNA-binding response OmpR family regulator